MDEVKICNNSDNEKVNNKFCFRKSFPKYTNECKQNLINRRRECRLPENFLQKKKRNFEKNQTSYKNKLQIDPQLKKLN